MKRLITFLAGCAVALALFTAPVTFYGCKTQPNTQLTAIKTLSSSHVLADSALQTFYALVLEGKVSTNTVPAVSQHYREYQVVYNAALAIVAGNTNAPAPANVLDAQTKFLGSIETAKTAKP